MVLTTKNLNLRSTSNSQNAHHNTGSRSLVQRLRSSLEASRRSNRMSGRRPLSESPSSVASPKRKRKERLSEQALQSKLTVEIRRTPTVTDIEMGDSTPVNTKKTTISLPFELLRPVFEEVDCQKLQEIDETLKEVPLDFLKLNLAAMAPEFAQSMQSVTIPKVKTLPKDIDITVNDSTTIYPTHVLAVTNSKRDDAKRNDARGRVGLYPVHSIIFAAHCARMPSFPPTLPLPTEHSDQQSIRVPVFVIAVPHPETFAPLLVFLYVKNSLGLTQELLPIRPPPTLFEDRSQIIRYASELAKTFTEATLVLLAVKIHGFWQNVCAFVIDNEQLWDTLDVLWEVLLTALAISTGNPHLMIPGPTPSHSQSQSAASSSSSS